MVKGAETYISAEKHDGLRIHMSASVKERPSRTLIKSVLGTKITNYKSGAQCVVLPHLGQSVFDPGACMRIYAVTFTVCMRYGGAPPQ